jgi:membrane protein YdbS with pleckstrin-like domain
VAISQRLLNEGERVVIDTRTHVKALLWPLILLVILLAVGTYVQVQWDQTVAYVVWAVVLVAIVWWVLRPAIIWATASYTFTDRRLITRSGVLVRRGHDMPLARISDIAYEFGLIDRMLGCGTLLISDASTHGTIKLHDIPHVEETQRKVNALLQQIHDRSGGNDGV